VKVLVTGAGGFVGAALTRRLAAAGHSVRGSFRDAPPPVSWMESVSTGDLENLADPVALTDGMDAVVHLAARVHMMRETAKDPDAAYRHANVDTTERLAAAAASTGVSRFVLMSSIKANGEETDGGAYGEASPPNPQDAYGQSKLEAERALEKFAGSPMTATALRPPLVYGPGAKGNFAALMRVCATSLPLPLDGVTGNRRSLLFLGNLTAAIERVLTCPEPHAGVYLLRDGEDMSTADLVRRLRFSFNRSTLTLPVPAGLLRAAAKAVGKSAAADRVCGSLRIDDGLFRRTFDWAPPFTVGQGLAATASRFRAHA
jgi:nucleoside-diphosphate-sugar epimerase